MPWKETTMINERSEFALKSLQEGVNFSALCREYGISRPVGYKWKRRFEQEGRPGMEDHSRKPHGSPTELAEVVICRISRLHTRHPSWGPKKLHALYLRSYGKGPSLSSVKRIFERSGWVRKRKKRSAHEAGRISSGRKASAPNEVWTVDFKGWWHTGDGSRCEPLTIRDEHSRYLLAVRTVPSARTEAVQAVFEELFKQHGLPEAIRSDNGAPFAARSRVLGLSRLSAWWVALGIDLERGRPAHPQDNGAHERMHRDIQAELQGIGSGSLAEQQAAFDVWREEFNHVRPHEALGMKTPSEYYQPSQRRYEGTPADLSYPGMISRRIHKAGTIQLERKRIPLSSALAGWTVGLKAVNADLYDIYFGKLRIGQIELTSAAFLGVNPEEKEPVPSTRKASYTTLTKTKAVFRNCKRCPEP